MPPRGAKALEAARERLRDGDNAGESGDNASAAAGDKAGEQDPSTGTFERRTFELDELQREALADARADDRKEGAGEGGVAGNVTAFWRAAGAPSGAPPATGWASTP